MMAQPDVICTERSVERGPGCVDPLARTLEVYRLQGSDWLRVGVFRDDARVRAEPFDAIELELDALWLAEP